MSADEAYVERILKLHANNKRKISLVPQVSLKDKNELAEFYTPGVAEPCIKISKNKDDVYKYTNKGNVVAVISDGTAVLGLGDIGPEAGLPVMEGKCMLFKTFANIDAIPIMLGSKDPEEIVNAIIKISPGLGAINLEDIAAPKCFEIERQLRHALSIPVMHDDQHGTAIVILAGLINALKLVNKRFEDVKVIFSGAGAAGTAICKMLLAKGCKNIIVTDRAGAIYDGRKENMNNEKLDLARLTNPGKVKGPLKEVIKGADVFIGVSGPKLLTKEHVKSMSSKPLIFAMANPTPEIMPAEAKEGGAYVVATGRSDFPNQINNCLAFPGVFRGALDSRATDINEEMKLAAAICLAETVKKPTPEYIIPSVFEEGLALKVGEAVAAAAVKSGVASHVEKKEETKRPLVYRRLPPPVRIRHPAPDFSGIAYTSKGFKKLSLKKYAGSYLVLFFYPMDFTFVCPTEIAEFSNLHESFKACKCELVACSGDSQYAHMEYCTKSRGRRGLGPVNMPLLADPSHKIAKAYGVYVNKGENEGVCFRSTFIIDDKGIVRHASTNDLPVGRNAEEILRLVQAFQYTDEHGEVCPANWQKGDKALVEDAGKNKEFWAGEYAKK